MDVFAILEAHFTAWCFTCKPRRGRRPAGGGGLAASQVASQVVEAWLEGQRCTFDATHDATTAIVTSGDPSLAQLRLGVASARRTEVLAGATPMCEPCARRTTGAMGRVASSRAAATRRGLTAGRIRTAIDGAPGQDPARSENEVLRRLGYPEHGNGIRQFIRKIVTAARQADAEFPNLPNATASLSNCRLGPGWPADPATAA